MHIRRGVFVRILGLLALCCALLVMDLGQIAPAHASTILYQPDLYQLHISDKSIWQYNGTPGNWTQLDNNPKSDTIAARGTYLYQMHSDRSIWQYMRASNSWLELDTNSTTTDIAIGSAGRLYQLHKDGSVWQYNGGGLYSWSELDNNPLTSLIVAGGTGLYQIHRSGANGSGDHTIWQYAGGGFHSWTEIDNNTASADMIMSDNGTLYQMHEDANFHPISLWRYNGGGMNGWTELDSIANTILDYVAAGGTTLYQLREINGVNTFLQNTSGVMNGWTVIDNTLDTIMLVANGNDLYQQNGMDGSIWQYNRTLGSWIEVDNNSNTQAIAMDEGFFIV